ncbi:hypothetical protein ACFP1I_10200 [Dyadobacter subterraneus]|uniref:Uncharacterized protein n=1 Tax=Dyadobacter subterraneus TaxID=2773304 RepID=A0ABR9WAL8_9BACT|nr:hypothetical protein [Dyadobacter subterraneus]MBE9462524.1 hypothetical protein [Dyadobacter subterraneus]
MARELEIQGLANKTRRKVANRPFEDVQGIKNGIPVHHIIEAHEKLAEKSAAGKSVRERKLREEPPTKARLTVREKKRNLIKSSISLADE